MKKVLSTVALTAVLHMIYAQEKGVKFEQELSWKEVLAKAKQENKYIFVDCYATYCGPCKRMEANTFSNDTVGEFVRKSFIAIKVQFDSSGDDPQSVKQRYADARRIRGEYLISALPGFLFFSPQGDLVHTDVGNHGPKEFIAMATLAMDPWKNYKKLLKKYRDGDLDFEDMPQLSDMARRANDTAVGLEVTGNYVHNYLDKFSDSEMRKADLKRIVRGIRFDVYSYEDPFFKWILANPGVFDSLYGENGVAGTLIESVAYREEVGPAMASAERTHSAPDWDAIGKSILARYNEQYATRIMQKGKYEWEERRRLATQFGK